MNRMADEGYVNVCMEGLACLVRVEKLNVSMHMAGLATWKEWERETTE